LVLVFYLSHLDIDATTFMLRYCKKNLRNRTTQFIESIRRSMGVHAVVLFGYETPEGLRTALYIFLIVLLV
jgi:hypothetical protein